MKFRALAIADVAAPLLGLVIATILAIRGMSIGALIAQQLVAAIVLLVFAVFATRWLPQFPRKTEGMKPLLNFGVNFAVTRVLSYVTQNVDSIAIGKLWDSTSLGLYDRAYRVSITPITQISFPMTRIAMPVLTRVLDDSNRFLSALREAQLIGTYVTATLLLVLGSMPGVAVGLLFGEDWLGAAPILMVLCISGVFRTLQQVANWVFIAKGLSGSLLRLNLIMQPMIVITTVVGVLWGPIGAAVGASIGYMVYWIVSILWVGRLTKLELYFLIWNPIRVIGIFSLPAALIAFVLTNVIDFSLGGQLVVGAAGALLWFGLSSILFSFVRRDLKVLLSFIRLAIGKR